MFKFEIYGIPSVQKQTRFSCINNKPHTWDPSKQDKERIQWQIQQHAPEAPIKGPIELGIWFYMPIPKRASSKLRTEMLNQSVLPAVKPDIDNMAYLITNALKKIIYEDDNQIVIQKLYKYYDTMPRTVIKIRSIEKSWKADLHENDF